VSFASAQHYWQFFSTVLLFIYLFFIKLAFIFFFRRMKPPQKSPSRFLTFLHGGTHTHSMSVPFEQFLTQQQPFPSIFLQFGFHQHWLFILLFILG
jgi:hypothetical protein